MFQDTKPYFKQDLDQKLKALDELLGQASSIDTRKIKNALNDFKGDIDDFEGEDDLVFFYYRLQYHRRNILFLKKSPEGKLAKEQKIMLKYSKQFKQALMDFEKNQEEKHQRFEFKQEKFESIDSIYGSQIRDVQQDRIDIHSLERPSLTNLLDDLMQKIPDLNSEFYDKIQSLIKDLTSLLSSFSDAFQVQKNLQKVVKSLQEIELKLWEQQGKSLKQIAAAVQGKSLEQVTAIKCFSKELNTAFVTLLSYLIEHLLKDEVDLKTSLFATVALTEENIKQHYRFLSLLIHPDRIVKYGPSADQKLLFQRFFNILGEAKLERLHQLTSGNHNLYSQEQLDSHISTARENLAIFLDWQQALKGQYSKLRCYSEQELRTYTEGEKKGYKKSFAQICYQHYRAACRIADRKASVLASQPNLNRNALNNIQSQQVELRKNMATMLHAAGLSFDAQIYALGAMYVLLKCETATEKGFESIQKILTKIKGGNHHEQDARAPIDLSTDRVVSQINRDTQVARLEQKNYPFNTPKGYQQVKTRLRQDVARIASEHLLRPDRSLVSYLYPQEEILKAKKHALLYKTKGALTCATGITVGAAMVTKGYIDIYSGVLLGTAIGGPIGGVAGGIVSAIVGVTFSIAGVYIGCRIFKKGSELAQEPKIREQLNSIIDRAMKCYHHDPSQFARTLSEKFGDDESLIDYNHDPENEKKSFIKVDAKHISTKLIQHGFRPDGIAYLLVTIAEVLVSGKLKLSGTTVSHQREIAVELLEEVSMGQSLMDEAKKLDHIMLNNNKKIHKLFSRLRLPVIPESFCSDAEKAPFVARLREVGLAAKLNLALLQIIIGEEDNLTTAQDLLSELHRSVSHHYQFFTVAEHRIKAVTDLLIALDFGAEFLKEEQEQQERLLMIEHDATLKNNLPLQIFDLNQFDDLNILHLMRILSKGWVNVSRQALMNNLHQHKHPHHSNYAAVAKRLLNIYKQKPLNVDLLTCAYLPLLSEILSVNFMLYHIDVDALNRGFPRYLIAEKQPFFCVNSVATLCLGFTEKQISKTAVPRLIFAERNDPTLAVLNKRASLISKNSVARAQVLSERGLHFLKLADQINHSSPLRSLILYDNALKDFQDSLAAKPMIETYWCITKCFLKLNRFNDAMNFLTTRNWYSKEPHLIKNPWFWYYCSKALRKLGKVRQASYTIGHALSLENNPKFALEKHLIDQSSQKNIDEMQKQRAETPLRDEKDYYTKRHSSDLKSYNILSVDGGGIRGIIPAVLVSELERRTHRPASHCFNLMSGTSTGGIMALGLALPKQISHVPDYKYSYYSPRYRASDILNMYIHKGSEIFQQDNYYSWWPFSGIIKPKYRSEGRETVLKEYCGETTMADLLTDVVVPAVNEKTPSITTIFTRQAARKDSSKNFKVWDVAMATSAAPTFFKGHNIQTETFVDGGLHMNNPAAQAYAEALHQGVDPSHINLLSLGTGDCVKSPTHPDSSRGLLFWATHLHHFLGAEQNNTDDQLHASLNCRYHRYQLWMENPIALDDISKNTKDFLIQAGHQIIEEADASDGNSFNKWVEHLKV